MYSVQQTECTILYTAVGSVLFFLSLRKKGLQFNYVKEGAEPDIYSETLSLFI